MAQRFYKIRARSLDEAYRAVRERYGANAVVINTHSISAGGVRGFLGQKLVEVTASVPVDEVRTFSRDKRAQSAAERRYRANSTLEEDAPMQPERVEYFERLVRDAQQRMERPTATQTPTRAAASEGAAAPRPEPGVLPFPTPRNTPDRGAEELKREVQEIKEMIQVLYAENPGAGLPAEFAPHYRALTERGVARKVAAALLGAVARGSDLGILRDSRVFNERLGFEIRRIVPVTRGIALEPGQCRVVALCGATGVGKTTNIAKLAAHYSVRERARVALVTSDTYRIAATEQLRVYANIIGVPLYIADEPRQAQAAVRACKDCDLVLMDTAGGSQFNLEQIKELKATLHAVRPHETILCLAANTQLADLRNMARNFECLEPTSLFFTKLDETRQYGGIFSLLIEAGLPLSYLSVGQVVPDDLRAATPEMMAHLVLEAKESHA